MVIFLSDFPQIYQFCFFEDFGNRYPQVIGNHNVGAGCWAWREEVEQWRMGNSPRRQTCVSRFDTCKMFVGFLI